VDFLSAGDWPWLDGARQRLRAAFAAQRLPHSLLLLSAPGLGAEQLANWITALALCDSLESRPCGVCASCQLLRSDSHPDSHVVRLEEDAHQIKIDQVRALIESLALKSYRGGYKVGVIEGAELLNANGANAFLKTLEERTANTVGQNSGSAIVGGCPRAGRRRAAAGGGIGCRRCRRSGCGDAGVLEAVGSRCGGCDLACRALAAIGSRTAHRLA
jgi:hypothetical protein